MTIRGSHCNYCGRNTNHDVIAERDRSDAAWTNRYEMLECRGCGSISLRNMYGSTGRKLTSILYPPSIARRQPEWLDLFSPARLEDKIPEKIVGLFEEIYAAAQNGSRRLAAMGIRSLLETVMVEKVQDKGTFKANVDAMVEAGYLSGRQATLVVQSILEAGHASVHRGWIPNQRDLDALLDITESMVASVYLHEDLARELNDKVPKRLPPRRHRD